MNLTSRLLSREATLSNFETTDEKPASSTKITLRRSKQFKIQKETHNSLTQYTPLQTDAMDRVQLVSTINDILNTMKTGNSEMFCHSLTVLSSLTHFAGFCSVFIQLNGIETLVSLKSRLMQEGSNKTIFAVICDLSFYGSEAAVPLLNSQIPDDMIDILWTNDVTITGMILKTLFNLGVDNIELFRSQLGTKLFQSLFFLLKKTLPMRYPDLYDGQGNGEMRDSLQDKLTELCLKILTLLVEGNERLQLNIEFVRLVLPLLRHKSTDIVLLVLRTFRTMTSDRDFARAMRKTILVVNVDGKAESISMIKLIAELFDEYLSRIRGQIGHIQLLWKNEPGSEMLIDHDAGRTETLEHSNIVSLIPQISANCKVLDHLSDLFSSVVSEQAHLSDEVLANGMLRLFGNFFSFYLESIEYENLLNRQNPIMERLRMDTKMMIKEDTKRVLQSCLIGLMIAFEVSFNQNELIFQAIYPEKRKPDETFFTHLRTLLTLGIPNLALPTARIVNQILTWRDVYVPRLLNSGLVEVLFQDAITQDIDDELTERELLRVANEVLARRGRHDSPNNSEKMMIERESAHRLYSLLAQSDFLAMIENHSQKRTEEWTEEFMELRDLCSEYEMLITSC
ncbi:hypothetical protein BLNAU_13076 [Blattamonas nauphoetae]|uniref:Uncharacterized protein n=1 Tax=Blattamonas nauphoetae TaxID=2049346 RepID=A0ABQ9XIX0_9EUKA|nr:hypothetical protein BLNAU_13076 [Blattamonas nauphoetae]